MKAAPFYITVCEYPDGSQVACETDLPNTLDDAADAYSDHMTKNGGSATVFYIEPATASQAPMATDVTDWVQHRLRQRDPYGNWPEWLGGFSEEEAAREARIEKLTVDAESARLRVF